MSVASEDIWLKPNEPMSFSSQLPTGRRFDSSWIRQISRAEKGPADPDCRNRFTLPSTPQRVRSGVKLFSSVTGFRPPQPICSL